MGDLFRGHALFIALGGIRTQSIGFEANRIGGRHRVGGVEQIQRYRQITSFTRETSLHKQSLGGLRSLIRHLLLFRDRELGGPSFGFPSRGFGLIRERNGSDLSFTQSGLFLFPGDSSGFDHGEITLPMSDPMSNRQDFNAVGSQCQGAIGHHQGCG